MRRRRLLVAVAGLQLPVTLLLGFATNAALAQHRWPGWLELVRTHPWHSLAALEALTVCLAVLVSVVSGRDPRAGDPDLAGVADLLAVAVKRQWNDEAELRQLNDPYPMPVRWDPADPDVVADWPALVRLATTGAGWPRPPGGTWANDPAGLAGTDQDLADVLDRVPTRRLVVLGEPGAGKTILLVRLVLNLLSRRRPGEAVPVLLPLASWNSEEKDLRSWIGERLITDHSALAEPAPGGKGVTRAQALLDAGLIMPVLDGLDEIPKGVRGSALARINDAMRPGESLVLAARTDEYRDAVCLRDGVEVLLTGAAGITLRPLDVSVVSDYLRGSAGGRIAVARWDKVLSTFTADCPPPVAQALTTPLLVALARAIYNPRPGETLTAIAHQPAELLDPALFPTAKDIQRHLFDIFIPAAYRPHPDPSRRCRWTADQARRWLVFLARDLEHRQNGKSNLAWWELSGAAPRPLAGISVGLVAGLVGALGFPSSMQIGCGLISALVAGLLFRTWVRRDRTGLTKGVLGGLCGGLLGGLGALVVFGAGAGNTLAGTFLAGGITFGIAVAPFSRFFTAFVGGFVGESVAAFSRHASFVHKIGATVGPVAWLINGLGFWLAVGLAVGLADRSAPARELRWSPSGFGYGLAGGLVIGFVAWIQVGSTGGLVIGLASTIEGGYVGGLFTVMSADLTKAATPRVVLVRDRAIFRSTSLGLGFSLGLIAMLVRTFNSSFSDVVPNGFRAGLGVGLTDFIAVGISFGFLQACWGLFTLAHWWLAASRHLPWRLMTFLDDAHARGVLRQVGAVYQFRHVELQRRLASDQRSSPLRNPSGRVHGGGLQRVSTRGRP
ncbi:MAG: NACHT domain-containing protein [Pseudonocardiaceae bacterium]